MVPWRSPSLGYAEKGWVERLSRQPSGHRGCRVPMNRWTNAGVCIDGKCERRSYRRALSWMRFRMNWCMESPEGHRKASAVCDHEQSKLSIPFGIPLGVLLRQVGQCYQSVNEGWWASRRDPESHVKPKVNHRNSGAEVLSIWRTTREEILLVLKKGGDISAFEKALDHAVQALRWCADCGGPFDRGGCPELARAR